MLHVTLRQLKVFESVARQLSFSRAAEELYLTQPAVSMQIKQLEDNVGLPLFEQMGKKIYLTDAVTKFSVLVIGAVVAFFVMNSQYLQYLPKFSLAAIMIFTGWKMISRLWNVAYHGQYAMILAIACSLLVYKVGIFEGLLTAITVHGLVNYLVFHQAGKIPTRTIIKKYMKKFSDNEGID